MTFNPEWRCNAVPLFMQNQRKSKIFRNLAYVNPINRTDTISERIAKSLTNIGKLEQLEGKKGIELFTAQMNNAFACYTNPFAAAELINGIKNSQRILI